MVRASGPGGQHVNKVSTAIVLYFDIRASLLPENLQQKLLSVSDHRISSQGVIQIKAQNYRSQELNRQDALQRLQDFISKHARSQAKRIATRPSRQAKRKRLEEKLRRSKTKNMRGKVREQD